VSKAALIYAYCLLPQDAALDMAGVEPIEAGSPLEIVRAGRLQAVCSQVGPDFEERTLNERFRDLDWLSPRAVRHHEVVDALFGQCRPILPLTFGAIFRSRDALRSRIERDQVALAAALDRLARKAEWDLKLIREEDAFHSHLRSASDALRALDAELQGKPPGTAFMLAKKIAALETAEARRVSAEVRADVHAQLSDLASEATVDELAPLPSEPRTRLEMRSAYLVSETAAAGLKLAVDGLSEQYGLLGYIFDLSGPWPPFSFAGRLPDTLG